MIKMVDQGHDYDDDNLELMTILMTMLMTMVMTMTMAMMTMTMAMMTMTMAMMTMMMIIIPGKFVSSHKHLPGSKSSHRRGLGPQLGAGSDIWLRYFVQG